MSQEMVYGFAQHVSSLKPGFCLTIPGAELKLVNAMQLVGPLGPEWNAVDQIMEKVVGSAFSIRVWTDPRTGNVNFMRLNTSLTDGRRTFVSPDRRQHFAQEFDGYYVPLDSVKV